MKQCTGCGRYDNEPLGININGDPYLACCPDNNYVEIKPMKLYTEEQVLNTVNAIQIYIEKFGKDDAQPTIKNHLKMLAPIELPSDEEIFEECNKLPFEKHVDDGMFNDGQIIGFERGAFWMKEQILNQNK